MKRAHVALITLAISALSSSALAQDETPPAASAPTPPITEAPVRVMPPRAVTPARAPDADLEAAEAPAGPPKTPLVRVAGGAKVAYYADPTLDAFASNDVFAGWSMDATYTFLTVRPFSLAAGAGWDFAGRSSGARGIQSSITTHRFAIPIEGRFQPFPWLYGFARVAPGAAMHVVRIEDASSPAALKDTAWAFGAEGSLGASIVVAPYGGWDKRTPRVWFTPELGYGMTTDVALHPRPDRNEKDVLGADNDTRLGSLALRGIFWRTSVAVTF